MSDKPHRSQSYSLYRLGRSSSSWGPLFLWTFCVQTCAVYVGFEVLTAASMKMAVLWVVAPCSLVDVYQHFRGPCCLHHQGPVRTSETLVNFYQTTRRYNPEDSHPHMQFMFLKGQRYDFGQTTWRVSGRYLRLVTVAVGVLATPCWKHLSQVSVLDSSSCRAVESTVRCVINHQ
jgi:hypothetical protein